MARRRAQRSSRSRNGAGSIARSPPAGYSVTRLAWRIVTTREELPIRRNSSCSRRRWPRTPARSSSSAAVASLTLVTVLDVDGLLGLGPAIVLASGALAALPAGRAMDRVGRVPVLALGFIVGSAGCGLAALGSAAESAPPVLGGPDVRRRRERHRAARAHRGRRHVPARASRARHRAGALRLGVRRDPRPARVQPAAARARRSTATRSRCCGWRPAGSCSSRS